MRSTQASVIVFLALITLLNGYKLTVQLESLELSGYLQDGTTKCSKLSAFGVQCYPLVAICIERITDKTSKPDTCLTGPWIELGVWPNNESITFGPTEKLRGWYNPQDIQIAGSFQGFYVKLRVQHYYGTTVDLIDQQIWDITDYKGGAVDERNVTGGQITSFQFAWTWDGAAQTTVSPKTVSTAGPTVSTLTTTTTTVTKVTDNTPMTKVTEISTSSSPSPSTTPQTSTRPEPTASLTPQASSTTV